MLSRERLTELSQVSVAGADRGGLADLQSVATDSALAPDERMERFLAQVKNPYVFLCGATPVRVTFRGERSLEEALAAYLAQCRDRGTP